MQMTIDALNFTIPLKYPFTPLREFEFVARHHETKGNPEKSESHISEFISRSLDIKLNRFPGQIHLVSLPP